MSFITNNYHQIVASSVASATASALVEDILLKVISSVVAGTYTGTPPSGWYATLTGLYSGVCQILIAGSSGTIVDWSASAQWMYTS